jgi:UDP-GlcNAc:undecaprenyl-phosphate GlcNAc-1-phosphate transferase
VRRNRGGHRPDASRHARALRMTAMPLWAYALLFLGSVTLSGLLTPLALNFAIRHGVLDSLTPRTSLAKAIPYLGEAAIVVAFAVALMVGASVNPPSAGLGQLAALLGLALVLAVVGLVDDVRGLPIWLRLGIELGAGVGVCATGILAHLAGFPAWSDDLLTIGWVVVVTNAFSLLDNTEGLSAGVAAISALGLFGIAVLHGEFLVAALAIALAGCAVGLLRHSFHPARTHLGDTGSLFVGFLLAVLALKLRGNPATRVHVAALVAVLGVALFDTALVVVSRLSHRRSPFTGSQDHTSHRLVHLGLPMRVAVGVVYATAAALAGIGVALSQAGSAIHTGGILLLAAAGTATLAMLALVPVYGDRVDQRIRGGPAGTLALRLLVVHLRRAQGRCGVRTASKLTRIGTHSPQPPPSIPDVAECQIPPAWTGPGVFIALPVLNERDNIEELLNRIAATMSGQRYVVCVVDDSSTDGTGEILQQRLSDDPDHLHVITRPRNRPGSKRGSALLAAIRWGLAHTSFDVFVEMDGDLSHRPEELPGLIAPLRTDTADVVIASKYLDSSRITNRPMARRLVSIVGNAMARTLLTPQIRDYSNGYRAYNRNAAKAAAAGEHHCTSPIYLSEVLAHWIRLAMRIVEVPTEYVGRNEGISKLRWYDLATGLVAIVGIAIQHHASRLLAPPATVTRPEPSVLAPPSSPAERLDARDQQPRRTQSTRLGAAVATLTLSGTATIAVVAAAIANLWFVERYPVFDELGLFNTIYMFIHTGSMTYPIYPVPGVRHAMFIHPPTHYFIVALVMLATHLSAEAAAILPVLFWIGISSILVWIGRFSAPWKFGGLTGLFAGLVLTSPSLVLRPEPDVAGAWITGLLALEAGRHRHWDVKLLGFGSFCLALASAMQYFSLASWLGVVPYALWILRDRPRSRVIAPLSAMALGGAVVGLPWLVLFVIPNLHSILSIARATNGSVNPLAAIVTNVRAMRHYYRLPLRGIFLHFALTPLAVTGLPAFVVTTPILVWRRDTRGIGLASLPFMLFLFLVDRIPHAEGVGYLTPEVTLYLMCVYALALLVITHAMSLARAPEEFRRFASPFIGFALVIGLVLTGNPYVVASGKGYRSAHPLHDLMGLARAAGFSIVGPGARMTSPDVSLFYTAGASSWYAPVPNPLYGVMPDLAPALNVDAYLRSFTAIPMGPVGTDAGRWYEDGMLRVRGFYFTTSDGQTPHSVSPSYVLLSSSANSSAPIEGYVFDHGYLTRYVETQGGQSRFVTAICGNDNGAIDYGIPGSTVSMVTPVPAHWEGQAIFSPVPGGNLLVNLVVARSKVPYLFRSGVLRSCKLNAEYPMSASHVSVRSLIAWARRHGSGKTIRFPEYPAALDALFSPPIPTKEVDQVRITASEVSAGSTIIRVRSGLLLRTSTLLWSQALEVPMPPGRSRVDRWVELRGAVRAGVPGMCILDVKDDLCLIRRQLAVSMPGPYYLPIPATRDPVALYIDNEGAAGPASLVIRSVVIVAGR